MYDVERLREFYDAFGSHEWARLEATAFGRMQALLHEDFLRQHIRPGARVLDAGCGPGRFSLASIRLGARVTLLDLSPVQLELARQKLAEHGALDGAEEFVNADVGDLSSLPRAAYDVVVCFGSVLAYLGEARARVAADLVSLVKPGGVVLVSVPSRFGATANLLRRPSLEVLRAPDEMHVWKVLEQGELPGFPSPIGQPHPAMHLYTSDELRALFSSCELLDMAAACGASYDGSAALEKVAQDPAAWKTAIEIERRVSRVEGMLDAGSQLILAARRR